jgi:hypothetical protein
MGMGAATLGALGREALDTPQPAQASTASSVVVWVWQFDRDGLPNQIRADLSRGGMGIALKTHDGVSWMSRWDKNENAVNGPRQVERLAAYFAEWGVPFHAWCVLEGLEPYWEAKMCAEVIDAGAQSLYLDIEATDGANYWQGTPEAALEFGHHLRYFQPNAKLILAPDARPWNLKELPIAELASFSNAIAPQAYWRTFDTPSNYRRLIEHGFSTEGGVTPELISLVSRETFTRYGLPVAPIGQGNADPADWDRFINASRANAFDTVSVWRYGTTTQEAFEYLVAHARGRLPARAPEPEAPVATQFVPAAKSLHSRGWLSKRKRTLGLLD